MDVIGVERPHVRGSRAARGSGRIDGIVNAASQDHVRRHAAAVELEFRTKAGTRRTRTVRAGNTLDGLERVHVQRVVSGIRNPEIGLIGPTNTPKRQGGHVLLDVGTGYRRAAVRDAAIILRTPEGPCGAIDAAIGAGRRVVGNRRSKTRQVLTTVSCLRCYFGLVRPLDLSFRYHTSFEASAFFSSCDRRVDISATSNAFALVRTISSPSISSALGV